jgi:hypothetical protein
MSWAATAEEGMGGGGPGRGGMGVGGEGGGRGGGTAYVQVRLFSLPPL